MSCLLCDVDRADAFFGRVRIWSDPLWRLSVVTAGPVAGFAHLEPHRHIPYVTDLDGPEAATFGPVLARASRVLREAADADLTYGYVFGERVAHFHVNLAPYRPGVPLRGGHGLLEPDAPDLPAAVHADAVQRIRAVLERDGPPAAEHRR